MTLLALALSVATFIAVLRATGAARAGEAAVRTARDAAAIMRAPNLDDTEKEARSRRAAVALFGHFLRIGAIGIAALALSFAVIWIGAAAGLYALDHALAVAAGWPFLIGASVAATLAWLAADRMARNPR